MQLKNLTLKNIRSYGENEPPVLFTPGISLFEGDIGSGKSTILTAIEFGLFGLGDLKSKHLLRHGTKRGEVSLTFESQGQEYTVKRALVRLKQGGIKQDPVCSLESENSEREDLSPSEIKAIILEILGFNEKPDPKAVSRIFRYAVYTPQEEMKEILNMKEEDRLDILRRAFGIEQYRWVISNVNIVLNRGIAPEIRVREIQLEKFPELRKKLDGILTEIQENEKAICEKEQGKRDLETKIQNIDNEINHLNPERDAIISLSGELPHLEGLLVDLNDQLKKFQDSETTLIQNLNEIETIEKDLPQLSQLYDEYQAKKKGLEKLKPVVQKQETLNSDIQDCKNKIETEKSVIENDIRNLNKQYSGKKEIENTIRLLNEERDSLSEEKNLESRLKKELDDLPKEEEKLRPSIDALNRLKGEIPTLKDQQTGFNNQINDVRNQAENLQNQLKNLESKEQELKKISPQYEEYCKNKSELEDLESANSQYTDYENDLKDLQRLIDNEKQKLESTIEDLKDDREALRLLTQDISLLKDEQEKRVGDRPQIKDEVKRLKEFRREIDVFKQDKTRFETQKEAIENKIETLKNEWQEIEIFKVGAQCPRCKQTLTKEHIKKIGIEYNKDIKKSEGERNSLQDQITKCDEKQEEFDKKIQDLKDPEMRLSDNESRLTEIKPELKSKGDERKRLEKNVKTLNEREDSLNKKAYALPERDRQARIQKEITKLTPKIQRYQELQNSLEEMEKSNIPSQYHQLTGAIGQKDPLLDNIAENERQKESLKDASEKLAQNIEEKNRALDDGKPVFDRISKIDEERKEKESDLEKLNGKIQRYDAIPLEILGYERQLMELKKLEPQIVTEESKLKNNQYALEERQKLHEKTQQLQNIQPDINHYTELQNRISELDAEDVVRKFAECDAQIRGKNDLIKNIEGNKQQQEQLNSRIRNKESEISQKRDRVDKGKAIIDALTKLESQKTEENQNITGIRKDLATLSTNKQNRYDSKEMFEKELSDLENIERKKRELKEISRWLEEYFIPAVGNIERHVLAAINMQFNDQFQKLFGMLVESDDMNVMVSENFTPIIEQEGYEIDVNSLSGGEKTSVALAYRLALNTLVKQQVPSLKNSLLILDEPTDGFSSNQLHKLRDILKETACDQIIMVSHEKELEGFVDTVYHVKKVNGFSSVHV